MAELGKFVRLCRFVLVFTLICVLWDVGWSAVLVLHHLCLVDLISGLDAESTVGQVVNIFFETYISGPECQSVDVGEVEDGDQSVLELLRTPSYVVIFLGALVLLDVVWLVAALALESSCGGKNGREQAPRVPSFVPWVIATLLLLIFSVGVTTIFSLEFTTLQESASDVVMGSMLILPLFFGRCGLFLLLLSILWLTILINGLSLGRKKRSSNERGRRTEGNNANQPSNDNSVSAQRESSGASGGGVTIDPAYYNGNEGVSKVSGFEMDSDPEEPRSMMPRLSNKTLENGGEPRGDLGTQSIVEENRIGDSNEDPRLLSSPTVAPPILVLSRHEASRRQQGGEAQTVGAPMPQRGYNWQEEEEVRPVRQAAHYPEEASQYRRREQQYVFNASEGNDRRSRPVEWGLDRENRETRYTPKQSYYEDDDYYPTPKRNPHVEHSRAPNRFERGGQIGQYGQYGEEEERIGADDLSDYTGPPLRGRRGQGVPAGGVDVLASHMRASVERPLRFPPSARPRSMMQVLNVDAQHTSNLPRLHIQSRRKTHNEGDVALHSSPITSPPLRRP